MITKEEIQELKKSLQAELLPVGTILIFPSLKIPEEYLLCDGRSLNKQSYESLYNVIGGTFGEDAQTFNLPDLRGCFVRGYDPIGKYDPERKLGEYQEDTIQGHSHKICVSDKYTGDAGGHVHQLRGNYSRYNNDLNQSYWHKGALIRDDVNPDITGKNPGTTENGIHKHSLPNIRSGEASSTNSGIVRIANETRPKNVSLMFCIKIK